MTGAGMFSEPTPSSVLYTDLKQYGKISNKNAALLLLSTKKGPGGKSPRDLIGNRPVLSRDVVNVAHDNVDPNNYGNFYLSCQTLYSRVLKNVGGTKASGEVLTHYGDPAANKMISSLLAYNRNAQLYRNELIRLSRIRLQKEGNRPLLLFMLFCITGCLGDPAAAVWKVENFARSTLADNLATVLTASLQSMEHEATSSLGLIRIIDGRLRPPFHPLSPAGTLLGSLAIGPNAITDVDLDVSRYHAKIWYENNRWLCEDLGSTNGTYIISGSDRSRHVIKPPRNKSKTCVEYPPQELRENDVLQLGGSTFFNVLRVSNTE